VKWGSKGLGRGTTVGPTLRSQLRHVAVIITTRRDCGHLGCDAVYSG